MAVPNLTQLHAVPVLRPLRFKALPTYAWHGNTVAIPLANPPRVPVHKALHLLLLPEAWGSRQ